MMYYYIGSEGDDASQELMAFKVLCEVLTPKNVKDSIDHIYMEYEVHMISCMEYSYI